MELKRDEIIKALECCTEDRKTCKGCPLNNWKGLCVELVLENALALINSQEQRIEALTVELDAMRGAANSYKLHNDKLTEENERLRKENESYAELEQGWIVTGYKKIRADTVRKMQERITEHATNGYPRKVRLDVIDQIAKEMLEDNNDSGN